MNGTTEPSTGSPGTQGETSLPTESELYDLLSSDTRRQLLDVLADSTAPIGLLELAGAVTGREGVEGSDGDAVDSVVVGLHHNHLPRLEDAGLIQYDPESNRVEAIHRTMQERLLKFVI